MTAPYDCRQQAVRQAAKKDNHGNASEGAMHDRSEVTHIRFALHVLYYCPVEVAKWNLGGL